MALVTLERAKAHLHITEFVNQEQENDCALKLEQANAVILDYLKVRLTAIETVSVANPTVVTTSVPHSLQNGATSTIAGTTTTPTINGARVITVTGPTTFTVPVNVTDGQSTAAGTVATPTWAESDVPLPIQAAILLMLTHLFEHRGDDMSTDEKLWMAVDRIVVRFRDPALA